MNKYLAVFSAGFQNEFTYRLNFILWRIRNVLRVLLTYFLWTTVFATRSTVLGYSQSQMVAYVLLVLLVSSFVMAAPSNDAMGGEIANGDLHNFLVKPISYLTYWFTRDWSSKALNLIFVFFELTLLIVLLKPPLTDPTGPLPLLLGTLAIVLASTLYYLLTKLAMMTVFWHPEDTWGAIFIILVCMEVLSGMIFPLHVLPPAAYAAVQYTPFPYLIYHPINILVGHTDTTSSLVILGVTSIWIVLIGVLLKLVWHKGLRTYSVSGR